MAKPHVAAKRQLVAKVCPCCHACALCAWKWCKRCLVRGRNCI